MEGQKKRRERSKKTAKPRGVEKHYNLRQTVRRQRETMISSVTKCSPSCLTTRVIDGVDATSRSKSAGCSRDEMMDEDLAGRIRASQGYHEVEVSCTGELGLHQRRKKCDKNPGHLNFISVKDFNIEHLPSRYRDNLLVDYVRATSDLTCRLSVSRISGDRPDTWPDSDQPYPFSAHKGQRCIMTGTGLVSYVYKFKEKDNWDCQCDECRRPGNTPKKTCAYVEIKTALHVVYDTEEARHTKCQLFYDSPESNINKVPTLTGVEVFEINVKGDHCMMNFVTHDMELANRLDKMLKRWKNLHDKVHKYVFDSSQDLSVPDVECDTHVGDNLCIIVSHPHGCTKVVTVGAWTNRDALSTGEGSDGEDAIYRYNTPTCPGSSGAAVITLCEYIKNTHDYYPPHSQGRPDNDNNSGLIWEINLS